MPLGEASPKRKVGGSNPFWRAKKCRRSLFSRTFGFLFLFGDSENKKREISSASSPTAGGQHRYTDGADEVLCKELSAERRKFKIKELLKAVQKARKPQMTICMPT